VFVPVPGGGLELVATAGREDVATGARPSRGAIASAYLDHKTIRLDDASGGRLGMKGGVDGSAIVAPILGPNGATGVIVVLSRSRAAFERRHEQALETYASFLAALLTTPPGLSAAIVRTEETA
jgi:hypothetical protein